MSRTRTWIDMVVDTVRSVVLPSTERRPERAPFVGEVGGAGPGERVGDTPRTGSDRLESSSVDGPAPTAQALDVEARARLDEPSFFGLDVRDGAAVSVVWRASEDAIAGARAIGDGALHLLVVRVRWDDDDDGPQVQRSDLGPVAAEGARVLEPRAAGEHLVVSLGLAEGESFVSVVHGALG